MAKVTWTGRSANELAGAIRDFPAQVFDALVPIVETSVREGADFQAEALDAATTDWGHFRHDVLGQGGSAGRNDTGNMIDSIDSDVDINRSALKIVGEWGWDNPEGYFLEQEYGFAPSDERPPPAALSLSQSHDQETEMYFQRVIDEVR